MDTVTTSEKLMAFLSALSKPEQNAQLDAYSHLASLDFPTTRDEYWKYTRVGKIANGKFSIPGKSSDELDIQDWIISDNYLVVENGSIRHDLSKLDDTFSIEELEAGYTTTVQLNLNDVFTSINETYFKKAIWIHLAEKKAVKTPLQLIHLGSENNSLVNSRVYVTAGKFAEGEIVQTFINRSQGNFNNVILQAHVEENANLRIHSLQNEAEDALHVSTAQIVQEQNSKFSLSTVTLSGQLVRNNVNIVVDGQNCESFMNGAIVVNGTTHVDNHTFVDHKVSNCVSDENYKYVLADKSTGVFNGKVIVRQDAQQINAYQNNGNVLLSDDAQMNSKPELEIYADDVKCSHGSTTGQLDDDALFYLQSRGISKSKANKMLVAAFIGEVIEGINCESFNDLVDRQLERVHGWEF